MRLRKTQIRLSISHSLQGKLLYKTARLTCGCRPRTNHTAYERDEIFTDCSPRINTRN